MKLKQTPRVAPSSLKAVQLVYVLHLGAGDHNPIEGRETLTVRHNSVSDLAAHPRYYRLLHALDSNRIEMLHFFPEVSRIDFRTLSFADQQSALVDQLLDRFWLP